MSAPAVHRLPLKSVAAALLFSVFLGPVGLLYASFWGGVVMILLGLLALSGHFGFVLALIWVGSCVWAVRAVETFNRKGC